MRQQGSLLLDVVGLNRCLIVGAGLTLLGGPSAQGSTFQCKCITVHGGPGTHPHRPSCAAVVLSISNTCRIYISDVQHIPLAADLTTHRVLVLSPLLHPVVATPLYTVALNPPPSPAAI
mgnify:CR=1 FL=1